jgi:hypothetical protein
MGLEEFGFGVGSWNWKAEPEILHQPIPLSIQRPRGPSSTHLPAALRSFSPNPHLTTLESGISNQHPTHTAHLLSAREPVYLYTNQDFEPETGFPTKSYFSSFERKLSLYVQVSLT